MSRRISRVLRTTANPADRCTVVEVGISGGGSDSVVVPYRVMALYSTLSEDWPMAMSMDLIGMEVEVAKAAMHRGMVVCPAPEREKRRLTAKQLPTGGED